MQVLLFYLSPNTEITLIPLNKLFTRKLGILLNLNKYFNHYKIKMKTFFQEWEVEIVFGTDLLEKKKVEARRQLEEPVESGFGIRRSSRRCALESSVKRYKNKTITSKGNIIELLWLMTNLL